MMSTTTRLSPIQIRYASADDVEAIVALGQSVMNESRFKHYRFSPDKVRNLVRQSLAQQPQFSCILLAHKQDGELVGILAGQLMEFFFCDGVLAQDRLYYVLPKHRGSQAAFKLVIAFRQWAEARRAAEMNINMSSAIDMNDFNKFMLHLGFSCCGSNFTLPLHYADAKQASTQ